MPLPLRKIGGVSVPAIGYGAMGLSGVYNDYNKSDEERFKILDAVYDSGCTFWDTADVYGDSEELLGKWFKRTGKRGEIFLCTKFGFVSATNPVIRADPEFIKAAFESSIQKLGVDYIDMWYMHRADSKVPIETSISAIAELVKVGKVKHIGLSEVSAETLKRAHAVHPIAAVQVEYSPFSLDIEDPQNGLLRTCRELGVPVVAYSPMGRGLLTGKIDSLDTLSENDFRRYVPRVSADNFPKIVKFANELAALGKKYGASPAQISLAWVLAQGNDIIPIPGTTKIKYLQENMAAADIPLSPDDIAAIRKFADEAGISGERYPDFMLGDLQCETPAFK